MIETGAAERTAESTVVAKEDAREVGDRGKSGSSCVFLSCSWRTRENFCQWNMEIWKICTKNIAQQRTLIFAFEEGERILIVTYQSRVFYEDIPRVSVCHSILRFDAILAWLGGR